MFLIINFGKIKWKLLKGIGLLILFVPVFLILHQTFYQKEIPVFSESGPAILIIDAGHGGTDGGAVSENGTKESEINLAIAQKMDALARLVGVETIMTRNSEELDYPDEADTIRKKKVYDQKQQVEQINKTQNAVLISVHQRCV